MPRKRRLTKGEVLSRLAESRQRVLLSASALPPERRDTVFLGEWSVKDLLAHLIGWDFANQEAAEAILAGRLPGFYAHHDRDWRTYNARLVAEHRREDFAELLDAIRDSHRRLLEYLQTIPADEFVRDRGLRYKGWRVILSAVLQAEASDEEEHHRQLEAFRQRTA
jgi:hypothetical protein